MKTQCLEEIVLASEAFRTSYKQGELWKLRVDSGFLSTIFSWSDLNHLLSTHRMTNDRLRLSLADDFSTSNKLAFRQVRDQFGRPTDFLAINDLHRLMRLGVTGVLEAANELIPEIEAFTTAIRTNLMLGPPPMPTFRLVRCLDSALTMTTTMSSSSSFAAESIGISSAP